MSKSEFRAAPKDAVDMNITQAMWTTLCNLYAGATNLSIMAVWEYCETRRLDVFKKPVHIVPMSVKNADTGKYSYMDIIMPGIAELRTTASRTGVYAGIDEPEFGPVRPFPVNINKPDGEEISAPEWCKITVYRMIGNKRFGFTHTEFFAEAVGRTKDGVINAMWMKRPRGQTAKCTEAGSLRKAFPEELGGVMSADEMLNDSGESERPDVDLSKIPEPAEIDEPVAEATPEPEADEPVPEDEPEPAKQEEPVAEKAPAAEKKADAESVAAATDKADATVTKAEGEPLMALPAGPESIVNSRMKQHGITIEQLVAKVGSPITTKNVNQALAALSNWGS